MESEPIAMQLGRTEPMGSTAAFGQVASRFKTDRSRSVVFTLDVNLREPTEGVGTDRGGDRSD
jgi:hypothetical protein